MIIIGLTGGIASGKSTVAHLLRNAGVPIVDADEVARDVVDVGSDGLEAVIAEFGKEYLLPDGRLDREKLGAAIFADTSARLRLNGILHPRIAELSQRRFSALAEMGTEACVYDVPLLYENRLENMMAAVIVVYVDASTQRNRLMARDGLSAQKADRRIAAQLPLEEKRDRADFVIDNSGPAEVLDRLVTECWKQVRALHL